MKIAILHPSQSAHFVPPLAKSLGLAGHDVLRVPMGDAVAAVRYAEAWPADVLVVEWANSDAATISQRTKLPLVIRLHRYETEEPSMRSIAWHNVRLLLVGSTEIRDLAVAANPHVARVPCYIQPAPIDLDEWPVVARQSPEHPRRIGVMANFTARKNPFAAIELMHALPSDYTLHVVGDWREPWLRAWWEHAAAPFGDRIELRGPLPLEDVSARRSFWREMDWCFAAGLHETAGPMAAVEAAACGTTPLVYWFKTAAAYWPAGFLWHSVTHAVEKVTRWKNWPDQARDAAEAWSVQRRGADLAAAIAGAAR